MILIENLTKAYDNIIFSDFSLEINDSQTTAILGPSGCGKTTLLNILLGLDNNYTGHVNYNDNKVISAVFQEDRLIEHITVGDNLLAVNENIELNKKITEDLGLKDNYDKRVYTLSGGMKRRVALARAIAYDGDIFIFDEPFKGIDLALKKDIIFKTNEYLINKTCVFVTHSISEAIEFSDRIILMGRAPITILDDIKNIKEKDKNELRDRIEKIQISFSNFDS